MATYALPKSDRVSRPASALAAETAMMKPAENAAAATAQTAITQAAPAQTAVGQVAAASVDPARLASAEPMNAVQAMDAQTMAALSAPDVIPSAVAIPLPKPGALAYAAPSDTSTVTTTILATKTQANPQVPSGMLSMAMDSDFDTGEPVGLETLVAKRIIVPLPKPELIAAAYANAQLTPASLSISQTTVVDAPVSSAHPDLDRLISFYAKLNGLPEALVHRVVKRESTYNPRAYRNGNYGLMQIRYNTAKGLGYDGPAEGLFDAETNIKYATKYLRGAWMVADNQNDGAVKLYASGYYYHAKRKGLLETLGMK